MSRNELLAKLRRERQRSRIAAARTNNSWPHGHRRTPRLIPATPPRAATPRGRASTGRDSRPAIGSCASSRIRQPATRPPFNGMWRWIARKSSAAIGWATMCFIWRSIRTVGPGRTATAASFSRPLGPLAVRHARRPASWRSIRRRGGRTTRATCFGKPIRWTAIRPSRSSRVASRATPRCEPIAGLCTTPGRPRKRMIGDRQRGRVLARPGHAARRRVPGARSAEVRRSAQRRRALDAHRHSGRLRAVRRRRVRVRRRCRRRGSRTSFAWSMASSSASASCRSTSGCSPSGRNVAEVGFETTATTACCSIRVTDI